VAVPARSPSLLAFPGRGKSDTSPFFSAVGRYFGEVDAYAYRFQWLDIVCWLAGGEGGRRFAGNLMNRFFGRDSRSGKL
jgi:hypothetical protein